MGLQSLNIEKTVPADKKGSYHVFLENATVVFDGFKALEVDEFGVYYNELRVVIGPNGAGKTTLCDVISGRTPLTSGHIYVEGHDVMRLEEVEFARMGVGRKFQTPTVFGSLTVHENMCLALPRAKGVFRNLAFHESPEEGDKIDAILSNVGLLDEKTTEARFLSHGQRQWLALSMLILARPKLLLVDEPAAGLTDQETEKTAELLLEMKDQHTMIVIEHDMEFVRMLKSNVTVMNEGKILAQGKLEELRQNDEVVKAYLGR
ncbi:MAG: urea ABC transporter ATP-binding protein UrtD [Thermodesulfobacteriota bacterium]